MRDRGRRFGRGCGKQLKHIDRKPTLFTVCVLVLTLQ